jgi:enoyl-CoA hydratase/carnithine racemase
MIFLAQRIDGVKANEYGLSTLAAPGKAMENALETAWRVAANGPIAVRAAKFAIDHGMTQPSLSDALHVEMKAYSKVLSTEDRAEGLRAFAEGRKPSYKGR